MVTGVSTLTDPAVTAPMVVTVAAAEFDAQDGITARLALSLKFAAAVRLNDVPEVSSLAPPEIARLAREGGKAEKAEQGGLFAETEE